MWASPRELLNVYHADESGSHIITVAHDILGKLGLIGKDLDQYSLETVAMFYKDATAQATQSKQLKLAYQVALFVIVVKLEQAFWKVAHITIKWR